MGTKETPDELKEGGVPFREVRPLHVLCPKGSGGLAGGLGSRIKISPRGLGLCRRRQPEILELPCCVVLNQRLVDLSGLSFLV